MPLLSLPLVGPEQQVRLSGRPWELSSLLSGPGGARPPGHSILGPGSPSLPDLMPLPPFPVRPRD